MIRPIPLAAIAIAASLLVAAELSSSAAVLMAPRILGVSPMSPARSASAQLLTVTGAGFLPGLSLEVTAPDGNTATYKGGAIQAAREASFQVSLVLANSGTYTLTVTNPDGSVSDGFAVNVGPNGEAPVIDRVTPDKVTRSGTAQTFRVEGKGFSSASVVTLIDPSGSSTVLGDTEVSDVTPTSLQLNVIINMSGEFLVTVSHPGGGATSNAVPITVK